ncbi:MAG: acetyltransferase [Chloroflexota bacterium]
MEKIVIFGTGDFAQVASVYFSQDNAYSVAAFTVDRQYSAAPDLLGIPVVPFEDLLATHPPSDYKMFVAIGFKGVNRLRESIYYRCKGLGYTLVSYINSKAVHWGEVNCGDNCFIFEHNTVQPFVTIGNDVIIWSGNHIGHHVTIGNHVFIASHAVISGHVEIGDYCFIGVNATFRDNIKIASECIIGAGATILKNTKLQGVYAAKGTDPLDILSPNLKSFQ